MLPKPTSPNFPEALKAAREKKGMSFKDLAEAVGISAVMPSRYENREHSNFGPPSDKTWKKLNAVLCGGDNTSRPENTGMTQQIMLRQASVEEIVSELKFRGATSIKIEF